MTKRKVPETAFLEHQAHRILSSFAEWLNGRPGRRVTLSHDAKGWRCDLSDETVTRGQTLADAAAQGASIVVMAPDRLGRP